MPAGRWATNGACSGVGNPPSVLVLVRVKAIAPLPPSLPLTCGLIDSWVAARADAGPARAAQATIAPRRNPLRMGVAPLSWAGATPFRATVALDVDRSANRSLWRLKHRGASEDAVVTVLGDEQRAPN